MDRIYMDRDHMPVPKYKVGQRVFVTSHNPFPCVEEKLIRDINKPVWRDYGAECCYWVITYRYQDLIGGKPFGRMHTEYTLNETEVYPTEQDATVALAQEFMETTRKHAIRIAKDLKRLGVAPDGILNINRLSQPKK